MGGKRQANVLSALIQNFDTVESAIETSANSAGSAIKENERYLDSIQGKIDQFNNAMQAMWSDTLNSDTVKNFVELGTTLVKILDAVGPLNVAFVGFVTFLEKKYGLFSDFFKPATDGAEQLRKQLEQAKKDLAKAEAADARRHTNKTFETKENARKRVADLEEKVKPYDDVDGLRSQREDLLKKQAEAQQRMDVPETTEEAKKDLADINAQLKQTNKELAEAEARLAAIDKDFKPSTIEDVIDDTENAFDLKKAKSSINGKKGARAKRAKKLQDEGKTFAEIEADPKIQQYTKDIEAGEQALNNYTAAAQAKKAAEEAGVGTTLKKVAADKLADNTQKQKTATTWKELGAQIMSGEVTKANIGANLKSVLVTKLANTALGAKMASILGVTTAELVNIPVTQLLTAGFTALGAAIWTALAPLLPFIAIAAAVVVAIVGIVHTIDALVSTSKELREELGGLKSELSDIKSEIDSLNGELETTQERMAELLAKDSLTFTEQEELENLQKQNDLLEREIYLLEQREKRLQKEAQKTFDDLMGKNRNLGKTRDSDGDGEEEIYDKSLDRKIDKYEKWVQEYEDAKQALVEAEKSGDENEIEKAKKKVDKAEKKVDKWQGKVDEELNQYLEDAEGIDYDSADEETRKYLDYIYNTEGRLNILNGEDQAKTVEIKRIFNKEDMSGASDEIDRLVEKLAKNPGDENIIAQIGEQCKLAEKDLKAVGLSVQDATDYFTKLGTNASFNTLEGKITEVSRAATNFESLLKGGLFKVDGIDTGLSDLFDEEGKIIQTKLSQVFQGTSDQTREDITRLLEGSYDQIKNGTVDVERLLSGFALKTTKQILEIQNKVLGEQNLELFPNLKDEIDGIIDKFNEFSTAVGSVVDALDTLEQARAEEAYSGSISIETLENLMKYTDDYAQLVEIDETGAIRLSTDAEKILIEQRIQKIKTDAAAAVQTAQSNLEQAKYNAKAVNETGPVQQALTSATDALAGAWAYLGSIIGDITDGNFSGMFERASAAYGNVTAGREEKRAQVNVSVEDAQEALNNALNQQKIANALTSDNIKGKYSSEEASGGNKTKEDVEKSALEKLMEDFQREMDYWENRIGANQARYEQLQNEIDLLEAKGQRAGKEYYNEQIMLEGQRKSLLESQKEEAESYLAKLEEGSEEWWEVANTLNDIEGELDDVTASIVDLQDAIGEIDTYKFEEFNSRLDDITSKLGTIRDLIAPDGEEDWFNDQGEWTEEGVAVLGTYIQELETYKNGLAEAEAAYADYVKEYAGNEKYYAELGIHSEQELYDKRQELIEQQYDYAQSISDTEQSVVDMYESNIDAVEEYTETLIDSYNDYIDSVKEALEAERDLYDFKKNVQKQSKDIAAIERRIASLSGSTNASDVAERRKLEAQLYESRESLNDTYYDHARSAQDEALDAEQTAYEETMNKFIEGLRIGLESATANMDEFLMSVTSMVTLNADTVLAKYQETELPLGDTITNPWRAAIDKIGEYDGDALELMNKWTQGGFFDDYKTGVGSDLSSPWTTGSNAASAFENNVGTVMDNVVDKIESNVQKASGKLSDLYKQIQDTEQKAANVGSGSYSNDKYIPVADKTEKPGQNPTPAVARLQRILNQFFSAKLTITGMYDAATKSAVANMQSRLSLSPSGLYDAATHKKMVAWLNERPVGSWFKEMGFGVPLPMYAKGTTGTTRDEWAITDEPQFGDELVLVPGKDGNLSFMRKGTGVVPADMTQKLFELAQIPTGDLMNKNLTAIVPNVTKNDFKNEFNFESLVHVDTVDSDTLPKLEKMVDKKIDDFSRALNYSLKKFAR